MVSKGRGRPIFLPQVTCFESDANNKSFSHYCYITQFEIITAHCYSVFPCFYFTSFEIKIVRTSIWCPGSSEVTTKNARFIRKFQINCNELWYMYWFTCQSISLYGIESINQLVALYDMCVWQ